MFTWSLRISIWGSAQPLHTVHVGVSKPDHSEGIVNPSEAGSKRSLAGDECHLPIQLSEMPIDEGYARDT